MNTSGVNESARQYVTIDCSNQTTSANSTGFYQEINSDAVVIIFPIFLLIGIPGNLITNVVVVRQRKSATFVGTALFVIAISDNLNLLSGCVVDLIKALCDFDFKTSGNFQCQLHMFCVISTVVISNWGLVAITMARVASLSVPFKARRILNAKFSLQVQAVVILVATVHAAFAFWLYEVFDDVSYESGVACNIPNDTTILVAGWRGASIFLGTVAPSVCILIGNSIIVFKVTRMKPLSSSQNDLAAKTKKRRMSILVILLNVVFLVSHLPMASYFALDTTLREWVSEALCVSLDQYSYRIRLAQIFYSFCLCLIFVNPTVNFILYSVSSTDFRKEVLACFCARDSGSKAAFSDF